MFPITNTKSSKVFYKCLKYLQLYQAVQHSSEYTWAATWQNQQNECAPTEDSYQPGHPPSLIRVFAVGMKKVWVLSYPLSAEQRLWSGWADAHADLSLRWAHTHFVGFVMSRLTCTCVHTDNLWTFQSMPNYKHGHLSRDMTKPTKWVCAQRRLRSARGIRPV